jgi:hypothetical protein
MPGSVLGVDLAGSVDTVVLFKRLLDPLGDHCVADRPGAWWAGPGGVVRARSDSRVGLGEGSADRLDSEIVRS